jgi:hypothetical protein
VEKTTPKPDQDSPTKSDSETTVSNVFQVDFQQVRPKPLSNDERLKLKIIAAAVKKSKELGW